MSSSAAPPQPTAQPSVPPTVTLTPSRVPSISLTQPPTSISTAIPTEVPAQSGLNTLALAHAIEVGVPAVFAFSPDATRVAVSSDDPIGVEMRDATNGERLWTFAVPSEDLSSSPNWIHAIAFSSSGGYLAVGGNTRSIYLLDAGTGALLKRGKPYDRVTQLRFSSDEQTLFSGSRDDNAFILSWDIAALEPTALPFPGQTYAIFPGERKLAVTFDGYSSGLRIIDRDTGSESTLLSESVYVAAVEVSPDGRYLGALTDDAIRLWQHNGDTFQEIALPWSKYPEFLMPLSQLAFSTAGALGIVSADRAVFVWDLATRDLIGVAYTDIGQIGFTPAGDQLVVSGEALTFWSVRGGQSQSSP